VSLVVDAFGASDAALNKGNISIRTITRLRIGSRGSQLALWQANHIRALLEQRGHSVEISIIKTAGDKITEVALAKVGTRGMFTKEIEEALADVRIDLAVHSLKDLPTEISPEFEIAAVPKRQDPRDVFCSQKYQSLDDLPGGARVGTSSLRRQAQVKALRNDLEIHPLRGNVDTRLRKLADGEYDAIILAAAGLNRLGKNEFKRQILPAEVMCPAAGQGALAIEIRAGDSATRQCLQFLDDKTARLTTTCERALLSKLGGGCQVPIGAYAEMRQGELYLQAVVASPDGTRVLSESSTGNDAVALGGQVAENLLRRGGSAILQEVYGKSVAVPQQP
jgi:hydroxymethylbilane synthase